MISTTVQLAMMVGTSAKKTIIQNHSCSSVDHFFICSSPSCWQLCCPGCCCYCGVQTKPASASNSWRLIGARRVLGRSPLGRD